MARAEDDARYIEETQALYLQLRGGGFTLSPLDSDRIRSWRDRGLPLELALQAVRAAHAAWESGGRGTRARPFSLQSAEPFAEELMEVAARRMVGRQQEPQPSPPVLQPPSTTTEPPAVVAPASEAEDPSKQEPPSIPAAEASAGGSANAGAGAGGTFHTIDRILAPIVERLEQRGRPGQGQEAEAPDEICLRCDGTGYVIGRKGAISVARACGCGLACSRCHGRGIRVWDENGYEFARTCECQTLPQRVAAFNAAQLPSRFTDVKRGAGPGILEIKGFDRFHILPDDPPALQTMKTNLEEFSRSARPGHTPKGLGLFGKPGTGKTHLLVATLARLTLERAIDCRYIEISFLFADLKAAISDPKARETVDKIDALAKVDVLAIDELGKGRGSVFDEEVLDELIGRRYNNGKLTLFATNFSLDSGAGQSRERGKGELASQSLRLRVGERVYSRLHEMVDFIDLPASARDKRIPH